MSKTILITGATSGFGEAMAHVFAAAGNKLIITGRKESLLLALKETLVAKHNTSVHTLCFDVQNKEAVFAAIKTIPDNFSCIDVLINNAGFGINKAFSVSNLDSEQQLLDVLVRTPMRLMHTVLPQMEERNTGSIINVSSVAGWIAGGTYSAAKSYLTVLSESIHTEMSGTGVKISALCPGFTRTEFHERGRMRMNGLPEFMWLSSDRVVTQAWKENQNGKVLSVPGWQYLILSTIARTAPRPMVRKLGMNVRRKQR